MSANVPPPEKETLKDSWESHLHQSYQKGAASYDSKRWKPAWGQYMKSEEDTVLREMIPLGPGSKVLDVATGTGRASLGLAPLGADITGVDISANMLAQAEASRKKLGFENVRFQEGRADALDFPDNSFDAVVSIRFLHLIPRNIQPDYISEMIRVLKPGGTLVLEWGNHWEGFGYGIVKNFLAHHLKGRRNRGAIHPHQVPALLPGMRIVERRGVAYPLSGHLWKISPSLTRALGRMGSTGPLCHTMSLLLVRSEKIR